jgi:1,4-alpha-glucan branching enzyme
MMRYCVLISALFLSTLASPLYQADDPRLENIFGPQITAEGVAFRYYLPGASDVRIAGGWATWETNTVLSPGRTAGYFETTLPLFQKKKYRYKLIVDGIWQRDFANPKRELTVHGDEISWFEIRQDIPKHPASPQKIKPEYWRFYYKDPQAKFVSLVGSFNNFSPYEAMMTRDTAGTWVVEVQVLPGEQYYCFVVDGKWKIDPERREKAFNRFGQYFSRFTAD